MPFFFFFSRAMDNPLRGLPAKKRKKMGMIRAYVKKSRPEYPDFFPPPLRYT